jgi:predicted amidohydrolase
VKSLTITPSISLIRIFAVLSLLLILAKCTVPEKGPVRVALAQTVCIDGDRSGNFVRIENAVIEAKEHGAHLVTFPETSILGWVNPEAHEKACPIPGSDTDRLCELAKKYSIMLSIGLAEKDGDHLYDSAVLIDEKGKILLKHRKINTLDELMSPPYTPGNQIQAVNTPLGRMGMLICADSFKPELLEQLKATKPDLVLIPYGWAANEDDWPDHGKALHKVVRNVARTTGCPVFGTDLVGQITHGPWTGMTFGGQSMAVDAAGRILAVGKDRDRDLLLVELDIQ